MELVTQQEETHGVGQAPVQDALRKACAGGPGCDFTNPRMAQMAQVSHQCPTDPSQLPIKPQEERNPLGF